MNEMVPQADSTQLDTHSILQRLPHRYPFLLVDRVLELRAGESILALKNVTCNEPYFQGHFPGRPLMPGIMIIEALAQATGILCFLSANVQSCMRLDDPYALVAAYTRKMMAFLLFLPEPRHISMIGLGGGSLAKFCYRHLPRTHISVVEINAEVISLREHFSIPPDNERFEVVHDDGATYLARVPQKLDVILIDAFDERGAAPSLASLDFYRQASQSLTSDGVLVVNLSGPTARYRTHIQSLCKAFDGTVVLLPVQAEGNVLLFALKRRRLAELPGTLLDRATELEEALGLEFHRFLQCLRTGPTLTAHADCS